MKNAGQDKTLQKAQAAERQSRGELLRRVLDQFAEVEMANGSRSPEDGPLFAIAEWREWTHSPLAWTDLREVLLDLTGSSADRSILESLLPASGPDSPCIELFQLADQLAHNRQLAEAAARWREIQQQVAQGNRFGGRD